MGLVGGAVRFSSQLLQTNRLDPLTQLRYCGNACDWAGESRGQCWLAYLRLGSLHLRWRAAAQPP
jgi:hypothetical protein